MFHFPHCVYETRCEIRRNSLYYSTCVYPLWIWIISDKIWFKEFLSKIVQWIFRNLHPRHCGDTFQCFEDSGVIEFDINFFWRYFHKKWIGTVVAKIRKTISLLILLTKSFYVFWPWLYYDGTIGALGGALEGSKVWK